MCRCAVTNVLLSWCSNYSNSFWTKSLGKSSMPSAKLRKKFKNINNYSSSLTMPERALQHPWVVDAFSELTSHTEKDQDNLRIKIAFLGEFCIALQHLSTNRRPWCAYNGSRLVAHACTIRSAGSATVHNKTTCNQLVIINITFISTSDNVSWWRNFDWMNTVRNGLTQLQHIKSH